MAGFLTVLFALTTQSAMFAAPAGASTALAPLGEFASTLTFSVSETSPKVITTSGGNLLTISGTMTNTGEQLLSHLDLRFQRGEQILDTAAVKKEMADPSQPLEVLTDKVSVGGTIAAGASVPFTASIAIAGTGTNSLQVVAPGIYPLMLNVNGDLGQGDDVFHARIGELHLLATVLSVPKAPPTPTTSAASAGTTDSTATVSGPAPVLKPPTTTIPVAMLWPVVDHPHLGVNGVFLDDTLTSTIGSGGRLDGVLDRLDHTDLGTGAITLVIDPELLDELERMSEGYRVVSPAGRAQAALTPTARPTPTSATTSGSTRSTSPASRFGGFPGGTGTAGPFPPNGAGPTRTPTALTSTASTASTGTVATPPNTVAGRGQQIAAAFLDRLRQLAHRYRVLALPYSDPDVAALAGSGMSAQLPALATKGRQLAARILRLPTSGPRAVQTTAAYPVGGVATASMLTAYAGAGYRSVVLNASSVQSTGASAGAVQLPVAGGASIPAAVADSALLSPINTLTGLPSGGTALQINDLAALMAAQSFDGSATPVVLLPDRQWTAAGWPGLGSVAGLLLTFAQQQLVAGTGIDSITATATKRGALVTAPVVRPAPLSAGYLAEVAGDRVWIRRMAGALTQNTGTGGNQPVPADLLGALDESLTRVYASSLRTDPVPGRSILGTIEATIAELRNGVSIRSSGQSYTLASSSSPLLLTVQNSLPYAVKIKLVITGGERVGLTVTQPDQQVIPAGRSQQFRVQTQVSRSGSFTVAAALIGPDGTPWGSPSQITVNSSVYGTVTIVIISVAGAVLLLMVVIRIIQRLRGKSDPSEPDGPDSSDDPTPDSIVGSPDTGARPEDVEVGGPISQEGATMLSPGAAPVIAHRDNAIRQVTRGGIGPS